MSKAAIVVMGVSGSTPALLRHAVEAACGSGCSPVIVVLDVRENEMRRALDGLPIQIVAIELSGGMGASIHAGLGALADREVYGAVFTSADQSFVTAEYLRGLLTTHLESLRTIVASKYSGTVGTPAFFDCALFPALLALEPDQSCNEVILLPGADVLLVECPEAGDDHARVARR